jgi:hypothetical protein
MVFGTTPNMAPPSNLKFPDSMGYNLMVLHFNLFCFAIYEIAIVLSDEILFLY